VNKLATNLQSNCNCLYYSSDLTKCDEELCSKVKQCTETGETVHKFISAVAAARDAALRISSAGKRATTERSVPWWTSDLTVLRKKCLHWGEVIRGREMMKTCDTREGFFTKKGTGTIRQNLGMKNLNLGKIFAPEP